MTVLMSILPPPCGSDVMKEKTDCLVDQEQNLEDDILHTGSREAVQDTPATSTLVGTTDDRIQSSSGDQGASGGQVEMVND